MKHYPYQIVVGGIKLHASALEFQNLMNNVPVDIGYIVENEIIRAIRDNPSEPEDENLTVGE